MFSDNDKISKRQIFRLLSYDLMGLGTLVLPPALSKLCGRDGFFSILIGGALAFLFLYLIKKVMDVMQQDYYSFLKTVFGKFLGVLLLLCYAAYYLFLSGYALYVFGDFIRINLLKEQSFYLITALILILGAYGIMQGIEGRARVYEILFWFLMLPLFFLLALACKNVDTVSWTPVFTASVSAVVQGGLYSFYMFSVVSFLLFLVPYAQKKEKIYQAGKRAVVFSVAVFLALYLILLGTFGAKSMAAQKYPAVTLMSVVQIPGGFLERQDAFMTAIWFFTVFALFSSSMFYSSEILKGIFMKRGRKCYVYSAAVITYLLCMICYRSAGFLKGIQQLLFYAGLPFLVAVPLLAFLAGKIKKIKVKTRAVSAILIVGFSLFLGGCSTTELENRNFPLAIGIDREGDSCRVSYKFQDLGKVADPKSDAGNATDFYITAENFYSAYGEYANNTNKIMDYNHVKVLILSEEYLEDEKKLEEFISFSEKQDILARNTLLFLAADAGKILTLDQNLDVAIGSYLEELMETREDFKLSDAMTLGDLYNEYYNREQTMMIPVLAERGGLPVIQNYYVMQRFEPKGEISTEEAISAYMVQGMLKHLSFTLSEGESVKLHKISSRLEAISSRQPNLCVHIKAEGEIENKTVSGQDGEELQRKVSLALKNMLEKNSLNLLETPGIDITDSFRKLGGIKRELFDKYQGKEKVYEKDLILSFDIETTLVN